MSLTDLIRHPEVFDQQQQQRDDVGGLYGGIFEFDDDDPDFTHARSSGSNMTSCGSSSSLNRARNLAMASVNLSGMRKVKTSPIALSRHVNLFDLENNYCPDEELMDSVESDADSTHQLTIENLRHHLNSCFSCGVSWQEEHVSLDCAECGGYPLSRPCPLCDGKCGQLWKRDLATSHSLGKANWNGSCPLTSAAKEATDLLSHQFARMRTSSS